jgi:hypothetical protein
VHHFGGAADAYADVIETDDVIAVVGFEIHAYDAVVAAAAVVGLAAVGVGVDDVDGVVDVDEGAVVVEADAGADAGADAAVDGDDDDGVDDDADVDAFVVVDVAFEHEASFVGASFAVAAVVVVDDAFVVEFAVFVVNAVADLAGPSFDAQVLQQS